MQENTIARGLVMVAIACGFMAGHLRVQFVLTSGVCVWSDVENGRLGVLYI